LRKLREKSVGKCKIVEEGGREWYRYMISVFTPAQVLEQKDISMRKYDKHEFVVADRHKNW
jgi:hypothetical protein